MKEGLEEFLKRIELKPTNETLIDRFVTLVLEEDVLDRILYLKKLVGMLLTPNPYAALKAAALELQEARKEQLTKEYEIGALKDVESCFMKLEKNENAQLIREEINKLQGEMAREHTATKAKAIPQVLPLAEEGAQESSFDPKDYQEGRNANLHFRLPKSEDLEAEDFERTQAKKPELFAFPPQKAEPSRFEESNPRASSDPFDPDMFGYMPKHNTKSKDKMPLGGAPKHFPDKSMEDDDEDDAPHAMNLDEKTRRVAAADSPMQKVGPNILDDPEKKEANRPRKIDSVFEMSLAQDGKTGKHTEAKAGKPREDDLNFKSSSSPETKAKGKGILDPIEFLPDNLPSNAMFQESQHLHFPENTQNKSVTRQDMKPYPSRDDRSRLEAMMKAEQTEIAQGLKGGNQKLFSGQDEDTQRLDPEELLRATQMPSPNSASDLERNTQDFLGKGQAMKKESPKDNKKPLRDPFAGLKDKMPSKAQDNVAKAREKETPFRTEVSSTQQKEERIRDPFAGLKDLADPFMQAMEQPKAEKPTPQYPTPKMPSPKEAQDTDPFSVGLDLGQGQKKETVGAKDKEPLRQKSDGLTPKPSELPKAPQASDKRTTGMDARWNILREKLRQVTGLTMSRNHVQEFVVRLLGEQSKKREQQEFLSLLIELLESPRQVAAEQKFLSYLFEDIHPKSLHSLLSALKVGDQAVFFFSSHLDELMGEKQLRRCLNIIHAVIIPGLDLVWYQEAYRFLLEIWPELGLRGWHWLEEEGPLAFCERLSIREDLMPATLLA